MTSALRYGAAALVAAGLALAQQTPPAPASRAIRMGVALGLSAEQRTQVQAILENQSSQLQPLLPQQRQNRRAIEDLVESGASGQAFDAQIQRLAAAEGSLISQMTVIRAKSAGLIWALLTPDQRQRAARIPGLLMPDALEGTGGGVSGMHRMGTTLAR